MQRQRLSATVLLPMLLLLVVAPGCAPVTVRQTTLQSTYIAAVQADVISTGDLSQLTLQALRMAGLQAAAPAALGTFQALDQQRRTKHDRDTPLAVVEFALWNALQHSVVIAHSMGGLLAKTAVSDSGDQLWLRVFRKAPDDLTLTVEVKQQIDHTLRFHRSPAITRVIFVAVPHRGSTLAENLAGKIGRMLIAVPQTVRLPMRVVLDQFGADVTPDVKAYLVEEDPASAGGLSPNNPFIQALADVAIDQHVPFHSIIGDRGLGDGEQGSDGVVPYKIAHLNGAEAELIVPTGHAAHTHPLAVQEVPRILKLPLLQREVSRS